MGNSISNRACGSACTDSSAPKKNKPSSTSAPTQSSTAFPKRVGDLRKRILLQPDAVKIGEGSFGKVLCIPASSALVKDLDAENSSASLIAVKVMPRTQEFDDLANRESLILSLVGNGDCPNIVKFFGWLQDRRLHCIVTEYCSGGELLEHLIRTADCAYSEAVASDIIRQVLIALGHCHDRNVVHLDLKLENLVLARKEDLGAVKLIDFGCAQQTAIDGEVKTFEEFCGTLEYAAPEVLRKYARVKGDMLKAVDMWSLGVLTYILSTGEQPFNSTAKEFKDLEIKRKIFAGEFKTPEKVSPVLLDFISRLLVVSPEHRMTVIEAMQHPWISRPFSHADYDRYDPMVLAGLRDFHRQSLLKKCVASFLSRSLSKIERERILASFSLVDVDGSGFIEIGEIVRILMVALDVNEQQAICEAKEVFSEFDSNDDGVISVEEFSEVVLRGSLGLDSSRVRSAFKLLDKNNDGMLSKEEIVLALTEGHEKVLHLNCAVESFVQGVNDRMQSEQIERLISQSDSNSDGFISFEEFESSMKLSYPTSGVSF